MRRPRSRDLSVFARASPPSVLLEVFPPGTGPRRTVRSFGPALHMFYCSLQCLQKYFPLLRVCELRPRLRASFPPVLRVFCVFYFSLNEMQFYFLGLKLKLAYPRDRFDGSRTFTGFIDNRLSLSSAQSSAVLAVGQTWEKCRTLVNFLSFPCSSLSMSLYPHRSFFSTDIPRSSLPVSIVLLYRCPPHLTLLSSPSTWWYEDLRQNPYWQDHHP